MLQLIKDLRYKNIRVRRQDDNSKLRHLFEEGLHLFFLLIPAKSICQSKHRIAEEAPCILESE